MTYERVGAANLAPGELRGVALGDGTRVCVGNADGALFAVADACTHSGFPLSEGTILPGGVLQCAWHGAKFDCQTGAAVQEPAFDPLLRFDVRVEDGDLLVGRGGGT